MQPPQYLTQDFDILLPTGTTNKNVVLLTCTFFYPLQNHISILAWKILGADLILYGTLVWE